MDKDNKYGIFAGIKTMRIELPVVSPACYSPSRRTIFINPTTFDPMSKRAQDFILCHEAGHALEESEYLADWEGFRRYMKLGYTPKDAIEAMNESLSMTTPQQQNRLIHMVFNAACYDSVVNNNRKILRQIMRNPNFEQFTEEDVRLLTNRMNSLGAGTNEDEVADFLGMSDARAAKKEARQAKKDQRAANKQAKQQAKIDKQNARNQVILSRAAKNNAKAEGIANGTYQGAGAAIKDALGTVGDTVKGIFGGGAAADDVEEYDETYMGSTETKAAVEGNGKMKWILIAVAAALVIGVVIFLVVKKKKK